MIRRHVRLVVNAALAALLLVALIGVAAAADPAAWVINATGETLSRINLTTGQVDNDLVTLGSDVFSYPNQIMVVGSLAYVVVSGTHEIQVIDLNSLTTVRFISTGSGSNPFWMDLQDEQTAWVSLQLGNAVARVNLAGGIMGQPISVGAWPEGVLVVGDKVFVACTEYGTGRTGTVYVVDAVAEVVTNVINVGWNAQYLALDNDGRIHVVCTGDYWSRWGMIYVIDPSGEAVVDSMAIGGSPGYLSIGPDNIGYLAAGGTWVDNTGWVYTYDAGTLTALHDAANPIVTDSGCMMAVAYQDGSCFTGTFKDFVKPIDSSGAVLAVYAVGDGPIHADFNYVAGDINGDFTVNVSDLTSYISWQFGGGAPPWPRWRGNVNGDWQCNISDVTYLVSFLFSGGAPPMFSTRWVR